MASVHAISPTPTSGQALDELKRDMVTACRILVNEGCSEAAFNVSCRLPDGKMLATPVTSPTLVTVDNLQIYPVSEATKDFKIHPAIYQERPDVGAIVHVHPMYAVAFSTLGEPFRPVHHYGAPFHGRLTTWDSPGQTGTMERAREIARALGTGRVILQQGHGSTAVGKDLREALLLTIYLEEACKMLYIARQMGTPRYLSQELSDKIEGQILKPRSQEKAWKHYADKLHFNQRPTDPGKESFVPWH
jgi:ribulose-5-phosphate 4-epimerase/fuculose-1-phosphate aldolase